MDGAAAHRENNESKESKMKKIIANIAVLAFIAIANRAPAESPPGAAATEDPAHQELRTVRDAMVKAFNERDYDGFLRHMHPNVVATWQNAEVARHPDGIKAYMKKMSEGDTKVVESVTAELKVDELATLYNDRNTAVAAGSVDQNFKLTGGKELALTSRWTATFVKENGQWLLAAFHVSGDIFNNPVLNLAVRKTSQWVGIGAAVIGLAAGWMLGRMRRTKAPSAT
jgi:uncharacterized protein (TIGR02246 family)